jgi:hypothetical protein
LQLRYGRGYLTLGAPTVTDILPAGITSHRYEGRLLLLWNASAPYEAQSSGAQLASSLPGILVAPFLHGRERNRFSAITPVSDEPVIV